MSIQPSVQIHIIHVPLLFDINIRYYYYNIIIINNTYKKNGNGNVVVPNGINDVLDIHNRIQQQQQWIGKHNRCLHPENETFDIEFVYQDFCSTLEVV
jgi:hypothetical protein